MTFEEIENSVIKKNFIIITQTDIILKGLEVRNGFRVTSHWDLI